MNMVAPDEGKLELLDWLFRVDASDAFPLQLALFTNDYTPVDDSTLDSFTQAEFTGGDPIAIERDEFGPAAIVSHVAYITRSPAPSWTCTAGSSETCYGWVLYDNNTGHAILAQRFDVARVMSVGATETLDPFKIALKSFA